ncbi:MAG: hypothetical protein WBD31_02100 [Rubripirellula sp.]
MTTPNITHLQAVVLDALSSPVSGRELRKLLAKKGVKRSSPAFYSLMNRMEEMSLIKGWYENREISGQIVRERHYEIRAAGVRALQDCCLFYANLGVV